MMNTVADARTDEANVDEDGIEVMDVDDEGDTGVEEAMRRRDAGKAQAVRGDLKETRGR